MFILSQDENKTNLFNTLNIDVKKIIINYVLDDFKNILVKELYKLYKTIKPNRTDLKRGLYLL